MLPRYPTIGSPTRAVGRAVRDREVHFAGSVIRERPATPAGRWEGRWGSPGPSRLRPLKAGEGEGGDGGVHCAGSVTGARPATPAGRWEGRWGSPGPSRLRPLKAG